MTKDKQFMSEAINCMKQTNQLQFVNANLEPVQYDGSEISWRVSAYAVIVIDGNLLLAKSRHEKYYDVLSSIYHSDLNSTLKAL